MKKSEKNQTVIEEIRAFGRCEWCLLPCKVEINHIYARGQGGSSEINAAFNLLGMCRLCHQKWHDGNLKIGRLQLPATKRDLWGIATEREVYKLLRSTE